MPRFVYGHVSVGDIKPVLVQNPTGKGQVLDHLVINDEAVKPTQRFWNAFLASFSLAPSVFSYFDYDEVFTRISQRAPNDRLRYTIELPEEGHVAVPKLLAVIPPKKPSIAYDDALESFQRYKGEDIQYMEGVLYSLHTPRVSDSYMIGPDRFVNKFSMEVPIDGWGRPSVYLAFAHAGTDKRCAVARAKIFKSELNLGKGTDLVQHAIERALDSYNNDKGFACLRKRLASGNKSYASIYEANSLYKEFVALISSKQLSGVSQDEIKNPEQALIQGHGTAVLNRWHQVTGDIAQLWGIANADSVSVKKQRTLPVRCSVMDLVRLAIETGERATPFGRHKLHAWVGGLIGLPEYDLEGLMDKWPKFEDLARSLAKPKAEAEEEEAEAEADYEEFVPA